MKRLILCFNLIAVLASGDTLRYKWGASVNGVVTFKDGRFRVEGQAKGKVFVSDPISPEDVSEVRFNSVDDNAAPPPETPRPRSPAPAVCEVVLKNGSTVKLGALVSIDKSIHAGEKKTLDKSQVLLLRMIHE